jgi:dehydrogenase/reductase SDR family protein 1
VKIISFFYYKFEKIKEAFLNGESTEFSGKIIVHLASNPKLMKYTSKVVISGDYAYQHGIRDIDGRSIGSFRQIKFLVESVLPNNFKFVANLIPGFVKIPQFVIDIFTSKF